MIRMIRMIRMYPYRFIVANDFHKFSIIWTTRLTNLWGAVVTERLLNFHHAHDQFSP
jgi:hypothetical protein